MQTNVSPDMTALSNYRERCPQWLSYIDFLANGDDRVSRLLRRYAAYIVTGYNNDQYFLFMWGVPNSGMSVFHDVLKRLLGSYVTAVSPYFFMRQPDKRTFELRQLRGKRGAFCDEVPKGATWDVELLSAMLSGTTLTAEGTGRGFVKFRNTAKIIVAGNCKPSFPSANESDGIDRRLLMLEFHRRIDEVMPDFRRFAERVVEREGPAILTWLCEEAHVGAEHVERHGSFMGETLDVGLQTAKRYCDEANPRSQWM
jgi:putative DNA primase/helicase